MDARNGTVGLVAAMLLLGTAAGVGVVTAEDFPSATDGDVANGEEVRSAEDDDDQVFRINYTFRLRNHQPGHEDGYAEHYAVGLTENGTLHRIRLVSEPMGFSDCEPGNTGAFGIDRGNDDPGTTTQVSLLSAFKNYDSGEDYIDITFYEEETLAGEPVNGTVHDQVVASQRDCYDNPSEPGWYRINGTITGNVAGGTETDYVIRDLSNYVYICDCDSRAEAEETLGPPPNEASNDDTDGGSGGSAGSDPTATTTETTTATPTGTATASATATTTATATASATATDTPTTDRSTATRTAGSERTGVDTPTTTDTAATRSTESWSTGSESTESRPVARAGIRTPTVADGPGLGAASAVAALLATLALLSQRRG